MSASWAELKLKTIWISSFRFLQDEIYIIYNLYYYRPNCLVVRVFTDGTGDPGSIPRRVIPQIQKMVLDSIYQIFSLQPKALQL